MPDWFEGLTLVRDSEDVTDWKFDFASSTNGSSSSDYLESGETISSYTITISTNSSPGLILDSDSKTDTNTSVTIWISGGVRGYKDIVSCVAVTSNARTLKRSVTFLNQFL